MQSKNKHSISVGGGKGGVGKSSFASNLAVALTHRGKKVLLIDTDIEASNLHTFVGVNYPRFTLDDFLNGKVPSIRNIVIDTPFKNLQLISSAGSILSLSGLKYVQRQLFSNRYFNWKQMLSFLILLPEQISAQLIIFLWHQ
jgi:flagellar biosynthesis protein FlhG